MHPNRSLLIGPHRLGWMARCLIALCSAALCCAALFGATSCATTPETPELPPVARYLPLDVGNAWTYAVKSPGSPPVTERIVIEKVDAEGFHVDSKGVRFQARTDGIFDGHRYLLETPLQVGHKWLAVPAPTEVERYEIVGMHERVNVKAGAFDECIRVLGTMETHMHDGTPATLSTEWTWAKDIGLIRMVQSVTIGATPSVEGISLQLVSYESKSHPAGAD